MPRIHRAPQTAALLAAAALFVTGCAAQASSGPGQDGDAEGWQPSSNVTFIVPFGPGGGYDAYSRKAVDVAQNSCVPEGIRIDVRNIEGGVAGSAAIDTLMSEEPDGHTMNMVHNIDASVAEVLNDSFAARITEDFTWVAGVSDEPYVLFSTVESGIDSIEDLKNRGGDTVRVGTEGVEKVSFVMASIVADMYGLDTEFVTAYSSAGDALTGAIRGDFDLGVYEASSIYSFVENGDLNPLLVFADESSDLFPDTPTAPEAGAAEAIVTSVRPIALHADTPDEIVDYWSGCFEQVLTGDDMQQWAEEAKREVVYSSPEDVATKVQTVSELMQGREEAIREAASSVTG
jgi:tripartite-type tricarboxylate transporter receptor subunit TctC